MLFIIFRHSFGMKPGGKNKKTAGKRLRALPNPKKAQAAGKIWKGKLNPLKSAQSASEGGHAFSIPQGVFYNPEMELCRDMFSLFTGTLAGKTRVADLMCASGVRGLRYKLENKNVASLSLSDLSEKAVACAKENAKKNKVRCAVEYADARELLHNNKGEFDFLEIDPFGTPVPFIYDAARFFEETDGGVLSVTATDMAVLCGANHAACLKNYGAAPLDNEFCHENAVRILLGKIALACAPFNLGITPLVSFSHRHYVKVALRLEQGAQHAVASVKKMGYVSYCPGCCWREASRLPRKNACPSCSHQLEIGGPMYLGKLWDAPTLAKMLELNAKRGYRNSEKLEKLLRTILAESRIESHGYYDLHVLAKKHNSRIMGMDAALGAMREGGFAAERTHFCPTAIRTGAPHEEVVKRLCK